MNTTKTYIMIYQNQTICTVKIDGTELSRAAIKEMVEFWGNWESRLKDAGGDYTEYWLKKLAKYIIRNGVPPKGEEGWYDLDGSMGITLVESWPYEIDDEDVIVTHG